MGNGESAGLEKIRGFVREYEPELYSLGFAVGGIALEGAALYLRLKSHPIPSGFAAFAGLSIGSAGLIGIKPGIAESNFENQNGGR